MGDMILEVCGKHVRLRETIAKKSGRTYWAVRHADKGVNPYGLAIQAFDTSLPSKVRVGQLDKAGTFVPFHEFQLEHGTTPSEDKDGKPRTPRPRVSSDEIFSTPHGTRQLHLSISEKQYNMGWQIKVSVTQSVSPEERAANRAESEKKRAADNTAALLV